MSDWSDALGTVGVWRGVRDTEPALAAEIEGLGFRTLWAGGSPAADLERVEALLAATDGVRIATGIVNIWMADPVELAASFHRIEERHPGRLLLGIGSGHREATPQRTRPLEAMRRYLDVLDEHGVPVERRILSALGPKMLQLAAERSAGTHPYLSTPAQSAEARAALGPAALIAPEQTVVFDTDRASSRASARDFLAGYLSKANYATTVQRAGFSADEVADGGSDRLVDALVAQGDAAAAVAAARAHLDAGADHVCLQVVPRDSDVIPALRAIAAELGLG